MAEIQMIGTPSVSSVLTLPANRIVGARAGEDIAAGDACYLDDAGRVQRSRGAAAGPSADVRGFAAAAASSGDSVTLVFDVTMRCGENLPPDASLYLSAIVPGGLADAPSPGSSSPVAFVVDATRIHVLQS
jgi:hypothetical protein